MSYEALEKHEAQCGYQLQQCPGCQVHITKKDFSKHIDQCPLISLTCADCKKVYRRRDAAVDHSGIICLKEQLQQLRSESQQEVQQLRSELQQLQSKSQQEVQLRSKSDQEVQKLRSELQQLQSKSQQEVQQLRSELQQLQLDLKYRKLKVEFKFEK